MNQETVSRPVSGAVHNAVDNLLRTRLAPYGYTRGDITGTTDHDGEPILRIDVYHALTSTPIDTRVTYALPTELQETLNALGEERFPLVHHHFHENQAVAGWR
jgi:hypothetical protein